MSNGGRRGFDDPVLAEIVRNGLGACTDEMSIALVRSAYSTTAKEAQDASTAIFDAAGQLVAQSSGTHLLHLVSLRECLREVLKDIPHDAMKPGDVYLTNDPYRGGIHANDLALLAPVHIAGDVGFFVGAIMHVADLGGITAGGLPAQATDVYQEGLLLPPCPIVEAGRANPWLLRIIAMNSRVPEKVMGDIAAMLGALRVGQARVMAVIAQHGEATVHRVVEEVLSYTEGRTRDAIESLSLERATGSYTVDDDGVDVDTEYTVRVTLERRGSTLHVDLNGTDAQARGPINAAYSQAMSGIVYGVRSFLDPTIPMNEGVLRPLEINLPRGSLVNPTRPAALNARVVTVTALVEAMFEAFSSAEAGTTIAASGMNHVLCVSGQDASRGVWLYYDSDFGGGGARLGIDGNDCSGAYFFGGRSNVIQLEALEAEYPVMFERYALIVDSGGPGAWRGGLGVERVMRLLADAEITVRGDRMRRGPLPRGGGLEGRGGVWRIRQGLSAIDLATKEMGVRLSAGDSVTMQTSGGGGVGSPLQRDSSLVADDVAIGRVSEEAARQVYGVWLGRDGDVDVERTDACRNRLGRAG